MLHHKTMVVDGLWATVGTTNFDSRSFAHNEENNVCLCDAAFSRELNAMFERDAAVCDRVDLAGWRQRPLLDKVMQGLASFRPGPGVGRRFSQPQIGRRFRVLRVPDFGLTARPKTYLVPRGWPDLASIGA